MTHESTNVPMTGTAGGRLSTRAETKRLPLANPSDHLARFPNARPSTIAHLIARERMTERLRKEVAASKRGSLLRRLWPSWVWRW